MFTFYKMSNLDNRIANADQLLTQVWINYIVCWSTLYTLLHEIFAIRLFRDFEVCIFCDT